MSKFIKWEQGGKTNYVAIDKIISIETENGNTTIHAMDDVIMTDVSLSKEYLNKILDLIQ